MKISCVIITRNEEYNIEKCLKGASWCDEVIVVDSGSTDKTLQLAAEYGARVVSNEFEGFGKQKQFACSLATHEWILSIDADEVVTKELRAEIQKIIRHVDVPFSAYRIPRRFFFLGRKFTYGTNSVDYPVRLFLHERGAFSTHVVHERVVVDGTIGTLKNELLHFSYVSIEQYLNKFNNYTTLAAEQQTARGKNRSVVIGALRIPFEFFRHYIFKLHVLNGVEGLIWSVLSSFYPFVKIAKANKMRR
ncbi:MAG: glycosyltransferase family 2 protein [Ignavibacteria bacterium]|nr:glycosyltransferase family 2 protein [Ignavibacteria bacterium]